MEPSDLLSISPLAIGGAPIQTTPASQLSPTELLARAIQIYPSRNLDGWAPTPPSQEAAASAGPLTQLGLSQLYPDLFPDLGPGATGQAVQDQAADGSQLAGVQGSAQPAVSPPAQVSLPASGGLTSGETQAPLEARTGSPPAGQGPYSPLGLLPPQPLQLASPPQAQLAPAPQLADVNANSFDFAPMFLGVSGAARFGRIGLERDDAGFQSLGDLADPAHATPSGQILSDGQAPTASVSLSSPSADELSLKPVVQDGRLQMAIYDDTTREKWVVDSTPGQSSTLRNAKGEPILFASTDLAQGSGGSGSNALTGFVSGLKDSEADQNLLNVRSDGSAFSAPNLGYQEPKLEAAFGLGGLLKDLALLGGPKLAAVAGIGKAGERLGTEAETGLEEGPELQEYRRGGGHHIPAQSVLRDAPGYNWRKAPAIPKAEMDRLGLKHKSITTPQMAGYRALARSGVPLTWDVVEDVETDALVHNGIHPSAARATVRAAIDRLKGMGVAAPTRYPGSK